MAKPCSRSRMCQIASVYFPHNFPALLDLTQRLKSHKARKETRNKDAEGTSRNKAENCGVRKIVF